MFMVLFMFVSSSNLYAGYQNIDGTSSIAWEDTRVLFDTTTSGVPDYAKGYVKFRDGFVVDPSIIVTLDITEPISSVIDAGLGGTSVGATGQIRLMRPITLESGATIPHGAIIDGRGYTISFDGNFELPIKKRLRVMSDVILDGCGNTFIFGQDAQLIIDYGVTVTLKNMVIKNTRNGYYNQIFTPLGPTSRLAFQDVMLDLHDDIYFQLGRLYIHDDVIVSGPHKFMYRSDQPSYIASGANFAFDKGSAFNYNPTTTADNLIKMIDSSSSMLFDSSTVESYSTPLRLTTGMLCFDNDVTVSCPVYRPAYWTGAMSCMLTPTTGASLVLVDSEETVDSAWAVSWSPDGKYLAAGIRSSGEEVRVYRFDGSSLTLVDSAANVTRCRSVSWSPDGYYLAAGFTSTGNEIRVYRFDGLSLTEVVGTGAAFGECHSVSWSPDGRYLAAGSQTGFTGSGVRVYKFDGSSLREAANADTSDIVQSVSWSPDGSYLAAGLVVSSDKIVVYRFDGSSLTQVVSVSLPCYFLSWSPDGAYLAVGLASSGDEVRVYRFNGLSLTEVASTASAGVALCRSVSWSPDGSYLAAGFDSAGDEIRIYRFDGLSLTEVYSTVPVATACYSVSWSPYGSYLAAGLSSSGDEVRVYSFDHDIWTCVPTSSMLLSKFDTVTLTDVDTDTSSSSVSSMRWSPDGDFLAVGFNTSSDVNAVRVYPFDGENLGTEIYLPATVSGEVECVDWSPDGVYLAVGFANGATNEVIVYCFTGTSLTTIGAWAVSNNGKTAHCVKWSPCGGYLSVSFESGTGDEVIVYRFDDNGLSATSATASSTSAVDAYSVSWTPDGQFLAVGYASDGADDEVQVYKVGANGTSLTVISSGAASTNGVDANVVRWSPDGGYLAVGFAADGTDDEVQVFKFNGISLRLTGSGVCASGGSSRVKSLDWSPDGAYLAVGYEANVGDEVHVYQFEGHNVIDLGISSSDTNANVQAVAWRFDGAYLAAGFVSGATNEVHVYGFGDTTYTWNPYGLIFGDSTTDGDLNVRVLSRARVEIEGVVYDNSSV